jgi:hypothetical protein
MTALRVGNLSIPLYADKDTSPSIHLSVGGTICYGSLESGGAANALNISYSGNTYHSVR